VEQDVPVVVFADVDGILRDPSATAIGRASEAASMLRDEQVAIVLCSLRTRAELELLQQEIGLCEPFVAEGGAAVFLPSHYFGFHVPCARDVAGYRAIEFGESYATVVRVLRSAARRRSVRIEGFSDMSVEAVASAAQMPLLRARLATLREYVEPFTVLDPEPAARSRLLSALRSAGLYSVARGRFDYVGGALGYQQAVGALRGLYERACGTTVLTIGIADVLSDGSVLAGSHAQVMVHDDDAFAGAVDLGVWAESLTEAAASVREQFARRRQGPRRLAIYG
jgi:mannosyl-3-phosphoglycerate phosphatase